MEENVFYDKSVKPDDKSLVEILGETGIFWEAIKKHLKDEYSDVNEEWKFYNQKSGWIFKLIRKKRAIFYLTPFEGYFRLTFWMGDKAVAEVEKSDLSENIINTLKNAKKYREGRSIQIYVRLPEDFENVRKLIAIKVHN